MSEAPARGHVIEVPTARPGRAGGSEQPKATRGGRRLIRQRVRNIDLWSVMKVAAVLYLFVMVIFLGFGVIIWNMGQSSGIIQDAEEFMQGLEFQNFEFEGSGTFLVALLLGLAWVIVATLGTVMIVACYNVLARMGGCISVLVEGDEVGNLQV